MTPHRAPEGDEEQMTTIRVPAEKVLLEIEKGETPCNFFCHDECKAMSDQLYAVTMGWA